MMLCILGAPILSETAWPIKGEATACFSPHETAWSIHIRQRQASTHGRHPTGSNQKRRTIWGRQSRPICARPMGARVPAGGKRVPVQALELKFHLLPQLTGWPEALPDQRELQICPPSYAA